MAGAFTALQGGMTWAQAPKNKLELAKSVKNRVDGLKLVMLTFKFWSSGQFCDRIRGLFQHCKEITWSSFDSHVAVLKTVHSLAS